MELNSPLDDKIVVMGMSCSGKTTFASQLSDHEYYCFDALFQWHLIETLGLSIEANLKYVSECCKADRYVLDGWHLADKEALIMPIDAVIYVIYSEYDRIIDQYRVPVGDRCEHQHMYDKWYGVDYSSIGRTVRFIKNDGDFRETILLECSQ